MASHPVYAKYPLDPTKKMIRVLRIDLSQFHDHDGHKAGDEQFQCAFRIIGYNGPRSRRPFYSASSYTWGEINDTATIRLENQEFKVTK